jgi:hypothetical protein
MGQVVDDGPDLIQFKVKRRHHSMAILNNIGDKFIDVIPFPETGIGEISRLGIKGGGSRSIAFSICAMTHLTLVLIQIFPLVVFVPLRAFDPKKCRPQKHYGEVTYKNLLHTVAPFAAY